MKRDRKFLDLRDEQRRMLRLLEEYGHQDTTDERREELEGELQVTEQHLGRIADVFASRIEKLRGLSLKPAAKAARLTALAAKRTSEADRIEGWLGRLILSVTKARKLETNLYEYSFRKSVAVAIINIAEIPKRYLRVKTTKEPDKKKLGKVLKSGLTVPGVELDVRNKLTIK